MSRYVPPHRKVEADDAAAMDGESTAFQRKAWDALAQTITGILNRVSSENLVQTVKELIRENIVRGRGLLARSILRTQQADPELTPVLASLLSRLNVDFPSVVLLVCKRLVSQWGRAYLRRDWYYLENVSQFLSQLYLFHVVEVDVIYQLILTHLTASPRSEEDTSQAAKVFLATFKAMSHRTRGEFHTQVLTPLRDLLAMDEGSDPLTMREQAVLENCLKEVQAWERVKAEQSYMPEALVLFDLEAQSTHAVSLEEKYDPEDNLNRFVADPKYQENEEAYEQIRRRLLGDNWEMEVIEEAAAAEAAAEEAAEQAAEQESRAQAGAGSVSPSSAAAALDASKTLIDENEREIRKEVYLAMRSSVRASEAVHKILKQMKPQTERTICFMVLEGCCEERFYKKIYGMSAERLCKTNARFQSFFLEAFHLRYAGASDLSEKQIEYSCKVFSHLLRTESLYWGRCLSVLDIVHNDVSQRLFIQNVLQGLAEEMGMPALKERLRSDRELVQMTGKLFPVHENEQVLEHAINLFVAMQLGELTAPLRAALEERRGAGGGGHGHYTHQHDASRKRQRD